MIFKVLSLFLFVITCSACVKEMPFDSKALQYEIIDPKSNKLNEIKDCYLRFRQDQYSHQLDSLTQRQVLNEVLEVWNPLITNLYLTEVERDEPVDVFIEFLNDDQLFGNNQSKGLLPFSNNNIVSFLKTSDTQPSIHVYLNEKIKWDQATYKGFLLYLVGKILGLENSTNLNSIMNNSFIQLQYRIAPSENDLEYIRQSVKSRCTEEIHLVFSIKNPMDSSVEISNGVYINALKNVIKFENGLVLSTKNQYPTVKNFTRKEVLYQNKQVSANTPSNLLYLMTVHNLTPKTSYYIRSYYKDDRGYTLYSKQYIFKTE